MDGTKQSQLPSNQATLTVNLWKIKQTGASEKTDYSAFLCRANTGLLETKLSMGGVVEEQGAESQSPERQES